MKEYVDNVTDESRAQVRELYPPDHPIFAVNLTKEDIIRMIVEEYEYWRNSESGGFEVGPLANIIARLYIKDCQAQEIEITCLADLKRHLQPGVQVLCLENFRGPLPPDQQLRTVTKVQRNGVWMRWNWHPDPDKRGWFEFEKANRYSFHKDGFDVSDGNLRLRYKYVKGESDGQLTTGE